MYVFVYISIYIYIYIYILIPIRSPIAPPPPLITRVTFFLLFGFDKHRVEGGSSD